MSSIGRPVSPVSSNLRALGFTPQSAPTSPSKRNADMDFTFGERIRRASVQSNSRSIPKGKQSADSTDSTSLAGYVDADPFAYIPPNGSGMTNGSTHETLASSRPSTGGSSGPPKKSRGSILVQAGDAIGSRFGRRRKSIRQQVPPPMPMILPGVIEISAPRRDEEMEERERLRDAAAQSIGLGPEILQETQVREREREQSIDEVDEEQEGSEPNLDGSFEVLETPTSIGRPARSASISSAPRPISPLSGRRRSGSWAQSLTHSRTRSTTPAPSVPPFPTTPAALKQATVVSAVLPKYHPPSSLLIFALSKQWKGRFMVLSSPTLPSSRGQAPSVSYLHLFKSSGSEEKELERLEINEDSVVFVAEEEVGGRKGVIKVGGLDVGAFKKELNHEIGGRTMWFLQILNQTEAQKWIAAIKNTILGQRSMRAGLGLPVHTLEGNEPRGDMDTMLTMRAQGIGAISSPIPKRSTMPEFGGLRSQNAPAAQPEAVPEASLRSSPLSTRSQATTHKSPSSGPVSALKGLFSGATRPRSSSRATSVVEEPENAEESFGSMGNSLLGMRQTNNNGDTTSTHSATPRAGGNTSVTIPRISVVQPTFSSPFSSPEQLIDRKITHDLSSWTDTDDASDVKPIINRPSRASSVPTGALSPLQPPPHRRASLAPAPSPKPPANNEDSLLYNLNGNHSLAGNFGLGPAPPEEAETRPPASPATTSTTASTPDQRARAGSLQSVSTVGSQEMGRPRRWSRPAVLPKRLTPPNGPPPAVPEGQNLARLSIDRSSSRGSSAISPQSAVSGPSTSSKRESNSSAYSASTSSTSNSRGSGSFLSRRSGSQRRSVVPPPLPAPTFAPPPPPERSESPQSPPGTARATKSSFRDSVAQRAMRLSLTSPKPPPSSGLPPRPGEQPPNSHHRSSSSQSHSSNARQIPSPSGPRFPPPNGPLPPPPAPSTPVSRHTSLKQRLRILSTPSSSPSTNHSSLPAHVHSTSAPSALISDLYASQPSTPIGEPITLDPNFLLLSDPEPTPRPETIQRPHMPHPFANVPEIMSLSPPPRRGSRQLTNTEKEKLRADVPTPRLPVDDRTDTIPSPEDTPNPPPLSRRGSMGSLIVSL